MNEINSLLDLDQIGREQLEVNRYLINAMQLDALKYKIEFDTNLAREQAEFMKGLVTEKSRPSLINYLLHRGNK